jgi:general secretion pathway protein G
MIVIAIIAMVAGGVAVVAFKQGEKAKVTHTQTNARAVRNAVQNYWMTTGTSECPTLEAMVSAEVLDEGGAKGDAWGTPWQIICDGSKVTVLSPGPDRAVGTPDDIHAP